MTDLAGELREAEERTVRLQAAADRQRLGIKCRTTEHEWRSRQSMCAWGGAQSFLENVRKISGVTLPHPGYHVLECIACGQWGLTDYCSGSPEMDKIYEITDEVAQRLL